MLVIKQELVELVLQTKKKELFRFTHKVSLNSSFKLLMTGTTGIEPVILVLETKVIPFN